MVTMHKGLKMGVREQRGWFATTGLWNGNLLACFEANDIQLRRVGK